MLHCWINEYPEEVQQCNLVNHLLEICICLHCLYLEESRFKSREAKLSLFFFFQMPKRNQAFCLKVIILGWKIRYNLFEAMVKGFRKLRIYFLEKVFDDL